MAVEITMRVAEPDRVSMTADHEIRSGGGGTSDYNALNNLPSINGVTVAGSKSGPDYGLADASDIPTKTSDLTNDSGFGTYTKPSTGIPKSDLASAVQTSLGKADTALQSVPSTYRTAAAQDTIDSGKADKVTEMTVSTAGAVSQTLDAGKIYHFTGALTALTITLNAADSPAQYHFDFLSGSTAPTLTLPNTVTMPDDFAVEANKRYEVDILGGFGIALSWGA